MTARGPYRLAARAAGRRQIPFCFDGRPLTGLEGDSLAAALLANGLRVVARSSKFRRPRGVFSAGVEEPNALVRLHTGAYAIPCESATVVPLAAEMQAFSHAGWPSVRLDMGRILDLAAPLWAAGFYNKTLMWPGWRAYEGVIRQLAGIGRVPSGADPERYDRCNAHCDTLIVGGGRSGLEAALSAAQTGGSVLLVEQQPVFGGRPQTMLPGIDSVLERLQSQDDVRLMTRTTAVGYYDHEVVTLVERMQQPAPGLHRLRERYWVVRAKRVVLATGAIEQPLIFCNNDRPGILLAGAAREYLRRYGVAPGHRVIIATNNDSAYETARDLHAAGVLIAALIDSRQQPPDDLAAALSSLSIPLRAGAMPVDTSGFGGIRSVVIGRLAADGRSVASLETFPCDALAVSGGFNPALQLFSQAGGKLLYREHSGALEPASLHPSIDIVGRAGRGGGKVGPRISPIGFTGRQWVDLRHDVTVADLELALRENYTSVEHIKRYTTLGMSIDQGKTATPLALESIARLRGVPAADLGHTTFRPPCSPVTLGAIAALARGPLFAPSRHTPLHQWHEMSSAVIEDFGEWKRPSTYPRPGESRLQSLRREALAVRTSVGIFDASPLGKIEVRGPDAQEFLDRFYINNLASRPGSVRYGLMLRESGSIFDDGTVAMLGPGHFLITTTSGNAERIEAWLEEWRQCEWPHTRAAVTNVTDQWATVTLSGPRARAVFELIRPGLGLARAEFPHLRLREGTVLGRPARVSRVSFTGELTFEISVPADAAVELWEALIDAGAGDHIQPFGIEALLLLRLEKGYLHVGTDTDGTTVPDDVGYAPSVAKPCDFIGRRSLALGENVRPDRLQLVGLVTDATDIAVGSHLRLPGTAAATDGWVSSAGRTVTDDKAIALALLRGGRQRLGTTVTVHNFGQVTRARVVQPPFYDPTGARANG